MEDIIKIIKRDPLCRDYDIEGAPYKINDKVKVLNNPNNDMTFDYSFANKKGEVVYFEYDCGCGQSFPTDPMIGVRFDVESVEEFWKEELEKVR